MKDSQCEFSSPNYARKRTHDEDCKQLTRKSRRS